jgi:hypothetical protein
LDENLTDSVVLAGASRHHHERKCSHKNVWLRYISASAFTSYGAGPTTATAAAATTTVGRWKSTPSRVQSVQFCLSESFFQINFSVNTISIGAIMKNRWTRCIHHKSEERKNDFKLFFCTKQVVKTNYALTQMKRSKINPKLWLLIEQKLIISYPMWCIYYIQMFELWKTKYLYTIYWY